MIMNKLKCFLLLLMLLPTLAVVAQPPEVIDSLRNVIEASEGEKKIAASKSLFRVLARSQPDEAMKVALEVKSLLEAINSPEAEILYYSYRAVIANSQGMYDSIYYYALRGLAVAERIGIDTFNGSFYNDIGTYHWRSGDLDSAVVYMNRSKEVDPKQSMFVNNNLGGIYEALGDPVKAIEHYELAYEEALEKKDIPRQGSFANNIGILYLNMDQKDIARKFFLKSIELRKQLNAKGSLMSNFYNMSLVEDSIAKKSKWIEEGLTLARELHSSFGIQMFLSGKADVLIKEKKYAEVLTLMEPMYRDSILRGAQIRQQVLRSLSEAYFQLGDIALAERYLKEYHELAYQRKDFSALQTSRELLLRLYDENNDYEKYTETARVYYRLKDSVDTELAQKKLAYLDAELRDVEQEKEIAILNTTVREKETRRNWLIAISLFIGAILSLIIYFRSRQVKTQRLLIEQEKKTARELATVNDQLKHIDHMKSQFFTNISHELRTPVTLIATPLSHTLKQYGSIMHEKVKETVAIAQKNARKLSALVEELLELSRIEAGRAVINLTSAHLNMYLQQLFSAYDSGAAVKHIKYVHESQLPPETYAAIDKNKLSKVINNLLGNALKFTPNGGQVTMKSTLVEGHNLRVSIIDTGRGIPKEDISKIFDRYYQVSTRAVSAEGGTGIGLSLVKELVTLMNGKLHVESKPGKGSTFTLELPLKLIDAKSFTEQNPAAIEEALLPGIDATVTAGTIVGNNIDDQERLLIVEDNTDMQQLLLSLLSEHYECVIANNGAEAWQLLSQKDESVKDISLILSDVMMPEMDGYTLLEKIKGDDHWRHLPVIMLTARAAEEDKLLALRMGVDDYLSKPFSSHELLTRTENLIQRYEERKSFNKLGIQLDFESTPSADQEWLQSLEEACLKAMDKKLDITNSYLADKLTISERHLQRRVKSLTGLSVKQYVQEVRLQKARHLLENKIYNTISEVAYASGFNTPKYFSKVYEKHFGIRPADYF